MVKPVMARESELLNFLTKRGYLYQIIDAGYLDKILTKKTTNNIIILVDDDGPGIPEKEYQNVMKPFYQIDISRGQN